MPWKFIRPVSLTQCASATRWIAADTYDDTSTPLNAMDSDGNDEAPKGKQLPNLNSVSFRISEASVKNLQAALFPIASPRCTGSFFANFLLKSPHADSEDNFRLPKIKESQSRELFSLNKEQAFSFQLPRWPTECQVFAFIL